MAEFGDLMMMKDGKDGIQYSVPCSKAPCRSVIMMGHPSSTTI
jgi:hypothetical protein